MKSYTIFLIIGLARAGRSNGDTKVAEQVENGRSSELSKGKEMAGILQKRDTSPPSNLQYAFEWYLKDFNISREGNAQSPFFLYKGSNLRVDVELRKGDYYKRAFILRAVHPVRTISIN
jgi:hypothetical protein